MLEAIGFDFDDTIVVSDWERNTGIWADVLLETYPEHFANLSPKNARLTLAKIIEAEQANGPKFFGSLMDKLTIPYNHATDLARLLKLRDEKVKKFYLGLRKSKTISGSLQFLRTLRDLRGSSKKTVLFLVSQCNTELLKTGLEALGLTDTFDIVVKTEGGSKADVIKAIIEGRKPEGAIKYDLANPKPFDKTKVLFIGDGKNDLESAHTAGVKFVGIKPPTMKEHTVFRERGVSPINKFSSITKSIRRNVDSGTGIALRKAVLDRRTAKGKVRMPRPK